MARPRRNPPQKGIPWALQLSPATRAVCAALNVLPIPGVGAMWAGWRNPHTPLLRHGAMQALLVIFGSWPLVFPGFVGFVWAAWDAVRIGRATLVAPPPRGGADPYNDATPQKGTRR